MDVPYDGRQPPSTCAQADAEQGRRIEFEEVARLARLSKLEYDRQRQKTNSAADSAARDSAIVFSIAVQSGADVESIRKALCRDGRGRASGPLGAVLDRLAEEDGL